VARSHSPRENLATDSSEKSEKKRKAKKRWENYIVAKCCDQSGSTESREEKPAATQASAS
jgi:hypothetical protein